MMVFTLGAEGLNESVRALLLVLATAAVVSIIFARLRVAAIPAFLITGALIGLTPIAPAPESLQAITQIAIVLLMFGIGLHMDPAELARGAWPLLTIGIVAGAFCTCGATLVAMLFGLPFASAVAVGVAVAMSSTAAVMRLLQQRRELKQIEGRISFAVLIVQDMAVIGALIALPLLAQWQRGADAGEVETGGAMLAELGHVALAIAGVAAMLILGRWVLPRLMSVSAASGGSELILLTAAAVGLGAAVLTGALGLSAELGAFLAGVILAGTPFRHDLAGQLTPLRDLFMAVFFVTIGLRLETPALLASWWVVGLGLIACILVKGVSIALAAWLVGTPAPSAVRVGCTLAQAGEFTLVVLATAMGLGLVSGEAAGILTGIVGLSLVLTPTLMNLGARIGPLFLHVPLVPWARGGSSPGGQEHGNTGSERHVIIAGFGPIGREVASRLQVEGVQSTIIELNPKTVQKQTSLGRHVIYGDATNPEVLRSAGLEGAAALILTMPDDRAMIRACRVARTINPGVFIAGRSNFLSHAMQALTLGADHVVVEEVITAGAMASEVIDRLRAWGESPIGSGRDAKDETPARPGVIQAHGDAPSRDP